MTRRTCCVVGRNLGVIAVLALTWVLVCVPTHAQDAKDQAAVRDFNVAAELQNRGLYSQAAKRWTAFIAKFSNDKRLDRAHYHLGICLLHEKKPADAAKAFETVLSRWPNYQQADGAQYNLGMCYYQMAAVSNKTEDFRKAAEALAKVPQTSGQASKALYFQGESYYTIEEREKAIEAYKKLVTSFGSSPLLGDALYAMGTAQQEIEKVADAQATFTRFLSEQSLQNHELATEVRLRLGMSFYDLDKFAEAEQHFKAAEEKQGFPHADFALLRQAQCRLEQDKTAEAATLFVDLTKKYPASSYLRRAQLSAGKCYFLTEKLDEAKNLLQPIIGSGGEEEAEAAYWLGRTHLKQDRPTDALAVLEKAVSQFKEGEFAPYLAVARMDALYEIPEKRAETAALYKQFVEQNPDHPLAARAKYLSALAALGNEDFATAKSFAEGFIGDAKNADHELTPAVLYIAAEANLLPLEKDMGGGDAAKAEQLYRQLVQKYPEHARAARSHLRIGWCLHRAKKYADTVNYLRGILGKLKDPEHVAEAQLLIGRCCTAEEKHPEAITAYAAAMSAKADWSRMDEVLIGAAQSERATNNANGAADKLRKLVDTYAASEFRDQALYQLGEIAQEQENHDEAIKRFQEVVEKHADGEVAAPARYGLAAAQFAKEQYDPAKTALDALLAGDADPQVTARAQLLRGLVFQRKKEFDAAVKDLELFLQSKPEQESELGARYALALCQFEQKQYDKAVTELNATLQLKADYELADKVQYWLGHALAEQDKAAESAKAFQMLAEKFPDSPMVAESWFHVGSYREELSDATEDEAAKKNEIAQAADAFTKGLAKAEAAELKEKLQYKLGDMRFRQEDYAEASKILVAQIGEHANGELVNPARYLAAESFLRQEGYQQAQPLFEAVAAVKDEKYHAESLFGAGKCAGAVENWAASEKHFSELIKLFGEFPQINQARYGHALAMHKQNKLNEALPLFEQITKDTETESAAKARFMIGEIAFQQGKYEEAIEHFLEVAVGYPYKEWQAMAQYEMGQCFEELKDTKKAIAAFQVVVEKHPEHAQAENAKKKIAGLQK